MRKIFHQAGIGAWSLAFSASCAAFTVHEDDDITVDLTLDAMYGAFHSQRSYDPLGAGNPNGPGSVAWQEGMVEYGAEMLWDLGYQGAALAARVSGVSTATWGDGDAAGFTSGKERKNNIEDAWLRWSSGNIFPALGYNGLEISAGRQFLGVGDGFLLYGDLVSFGKGGLYPALNNRGGAYYLAGRSAFANSFAVSLGGEEGLRGDLMWIKSDNDVQDKVKMLVANMEYVAPMGTVGLTYLRGLNASSGSPGIRSEKDGMDVWSVRAQGDAGVENLFLSAEFVHQDLAAHSSNERGWYVACGWTFANLW